MTPNLSPAQANLRECIGKVATGPEYSKDITFDQAYDAMRFILSGEADPVQVAIFLIALRMKRETDDENRGILQAIVEQTKPLEVDVPELVDISDPYDGFSRGLPASPFLPAVLAAAGLPAVTHGLEFVGPKFGTTPRMVLAAAGKNVDLTKEEARRQLENPEIGWAYIDQASYCPPLHDLVKFRTRMVKRTVLTTVEVLVGPLRSKGTTHFMTGYVHKAYPPIYASLARQSGFDSMVLVRGVEGGVIPSLQQPGRVWTYQDKGEEQMTEVSPVDLGIEQESRAVPITKNITGSPLAKVEGAVLDTKAAAEAAAEAGLAALGGAKGAMRDSLVYSGAILLHQLGKADSMESAANMIKKVLDSGQALVRFGAA
ncbi:MAG: anthranilate phosphoribosyltransferase [bacterium]